MPHHPQLLFGYNHAGSFSRPDLGLPHILVSSVVLHGAVRQRLTEIHHMHIILIVLGYASDEVLDEGEDL